ncbi:MAG: NAD-dependent epimerase/dehydratase family protein [Thermoleophilaceae bacterium]
MRVFLTGGTGFVGGALATRLRARDDEVVALVRSRAKAGRLEQLGCTLVEGDLSRSDVLRDAASGCDAVIHGAAIYKVGVPAREHQTMYETNVRGTERVLDAAFEAGVGRIVYVSTVNVFGNTHGEVVDESYRRPENGFLSYYDETKYMAHQAALERIEKGVPIVIVQPGAVYGPEDHSAVGDVIDQTRTGKLKLLPFPELGLNLVHVEDVADGIVLALDSATIGESYVLGGEMTTMKQLVDRVAALAERKPPRGTLPTAAIRLGAPAGPVLGKLLGFPPNFRELISASEGVTYLATDDKARSQLGYAPRGLDRGLRETLEKNSG